MTMPHLMNCSHSDDGWCLRCVKELHDEYKRIRAEKEDMKIRNQILRKRSDLPLHRTEDYRRIDKHLTDLRTELAAARARIAELEQGVKT